MSKLVRAAVLVLFLAQAGPVTAEESVTPDPGAARCLVAGALDDVNRKDALLARIEQIPPERILEQRQRLADLKLEYGPLDERLFDDTMALGLAYREAGDHQNSAVLLHNALQVERVNRGLYGDGQLPVLDYLIEAHRAMRNWRTVSDLNDFRLWIYRRHYGPDDPRILPALREAFRWHVGAYNKETGYTLDSHYNEAQLLEFHLLRIAGECTGDPALARCYLQGNCCADAAGCAADPAATP